VATDLQDRLQSALSTAYFVERELGGGGMARVFVVSELSLERRVVLKVLPPDMAAAVSVERFRREIRLAALLQHPHIVPLLAAGQAGELFYYTMPFVEGESLRARLARDGQLSIGETVHILCDVADALAYAHAHGVVHRDIKPDNILLTGHHAVVTDFGVAKAVSAASDMGSLTSVGIALGTPAYMAPEQALADPQVDHRADLYAVGVLAYEMLCGRPPFAGLPPQQILAAHLTRMPEPVEVYRPSAPPALAAVVMRCLAKSPDERVQRADELLAELEMVATPSGRDTHSREQGESDPTEKRDRSTAPSRAAERRHPRRRTLVVGALALAALGLSAATYSAMRALGIGPAATLMSSGALSQRQPIILADFTNRSADTTLGPTLTEAFRVDLSQSPTVRLVDSRSIATGLQRMERSPREPLTPILARELAERAGVKAVITGEINPVGQGYVLSASVISAVDGAVLAAVREDAEESASLLPALDRLSTSLRKRIGESLTTLRSATPLEQVTTRSMAALRAYTEAIRLSNAGDYENAVPLLRRATTLDTGFAMAWRKLAVTLENTSAPKQQTVDAAARAYAHRDRLPELERYLTTAYYDGKVNYDPAGEIAAYRAALELNPNNDVALNNLALALMRDRQYGEAESLLVRGVRLTHGDVYYMNMIEVQLAQGHLADARATMDSYARDLPNDANVPLVRASLVAAQQHFDSAGTIVKGVLAARPPGQFVREQAAMLLSTMELAGGQLARAEQLARDVMASAESRGALGDYLGVAVSLAWIDLRLRNRPADGLRRVDAALARHPLASIPPADRPYSTLATFYAIAGRTGEAKRLLDEADRTLPAGLLRGDHGRFATRGAIALAEGRPGDAIAEFGAFHDSTGCLSCGLFEVAWIHDRMGQSDSARTAYERFVTVPALHPGIDEVMGFATAYKRLGELYEARGDRAKAIAYYGRFVELWKHADPELQPSVRDARNRIGRLTAEG
jgi:serine/threonine-protein kinase